MAAVVNGVLVWELQAGYPKLSGKQGDEKIVAQYAASVAALETQLPAFFTPFDAAAWPSCYNLSYLILTERSVEPDAAGQHYVVTLTYSNPEGEATSSTVTEEVELTSQDESVPIEQNPNYLTNWNNRLIAKGGFTATPAWWATARTKVTGSEYYAWIGVSDQVPEGWVELQAAVKPHLSTFLGGVKVVRVTKRSRTKTALQNDANDDYKLVDPPEKFGIAGDWLRGGSSIKRDGKYWVMTVDFTNARNIDGDVYGEA
ncbi:MAG: hypothetical protein VB042_05400 [Victivallaceae bacterium]|nr:hypothetical protein [Victivallaceae bacterium]